MTGELPPNSIGARIRELRGGMSLSELAQASGVSKSYLWNLENKSEHQRPSAETLYSIAKALNTTMSELLGRQLLTEPNEEIDETLRHFADEEGLAPSDVKMLASIRWRGSPPRTIERWRFVYNALDMSRSIDSKTPSNAHRVPPRRQKRKK